MPADFVDYLLTQSRSGVEHGHDDGGDAQPGVQVRAHPLDVAEQLPETLKCVVLALDRDSDLVGRR